MRRPIIAFAAAACLGLSACAPSTPSDTRTPTEMASGPAESATPTTSPSSAGAPSSSPSVSPSMTKSPSASASPSASPSATASASAKATAESVDLATQTFAISPQDAIRIATEKAGGGFAHSLELDWSRYHGAWVYELDVLVGTMDHDIDINADTGEVLELERDDTDDQEKAIDLDSPMKWEEARDLALQSVKGRITSWKLEYDDKYTAYEFDIEDSSGDEIEVEVNVATGKVAIDD